MPESQGGSCLCAPASECMLVRKWPGKAKTAQNTTMGQVNVVLWGSVRSRSVKVLYSGPTPGSNLLAQTPFEAQFLPSLSCVQTSLHVMVLMPHACIACIRLSTRCTTFTGQGRPTSRGAHSFPSMVQMRSSSLGLAEASDLIPTSIASANAPCRHLWPASLTVNPTGFSFLGSASSPGA